MILLELIELTTGLGLDRWKISCRITGVEDLRFFEENVCWSRATNLVNDVEGLRLRGCCVRGMDRDYPVINQRNVL